MNRGFRSGIETVVIWLVGAVVIPSLLLSLVSFWAMRQQEQFMQLAARQRAMVLLSEAEAQLHAQLDELRNKFSRLAKKLSSSASLEETTQAFANFRAKEAFLESLFLLDAEGNVLLPQIPPPLAMDPPASSEWEGAQRYEFVLEDLTRAVNAYQKIRLTDSRLAPYAMNAIARCAVKQGDFRTAQLAYTDLLNSSDLIPAFLRLGASYQLAQLKKRLQQPEVAARLVVEGLEWMVRTAQPEDYHTCAYYLEQMKQFWATLPVPGIPPTLQQRWSKGHQQWNERFAEYRVDATLKEILLPALWPQIVALPRGEVHYVSGNTSLGWQAALVMHLPSGEYVGGVVSLALLKKTLLLALNDRLRRLGERAEGSILEATEFSPKSSFAVLRLAPPLNFWQFVVNASDVSPVARWQGRLMMWSVTLCLGAILVGVYWTWKRIQQEGALSRLKTDFVSNVSHELRTPLASIRLFVETLRLKRYRSASEAEEYLTILQQENERLTRLVNRVLDFSRMEQGRKQFHFAEGDLKAVVKETVEVFQRQMGEEQCEFFIQIVEDIPALTFDRDAIAEVLLNLLYNAVKYSHPPRRVSVRLARGNGTVTLAVQDNGIGIPKREQKRIFERFYRVDDTLTREVEGSGLGLAMVQYIVEAHGATISVESTVGEGSTFTVTFHVKE